MRCHYEVLEVDRTADEEALRRAYRKAALRWHPDKNKDREEEAAERFKEIQASYEVLTDKHERSWYDSHRDQILRSKGAWAPGADAPAAQAPEDLPDLFRFFSGTCYSNYGDGPKGFYAVYGGVFDQVAEQEAAAAAALGREAPPAYAFGGADLPWADVHAFYRHFSEFVSLLSFAWADKHYPPSAPNRKVRRLMEEENAKARKGARQKYSDLVRSLAAFVRRRDKRVAAHQAQEAERALALEAEAAARKEREQQERAERQARAREYEQAQWEAEKAERAARRGGRASDSEAESGGGGSEGELTPDLHCLACDKTFRTPNAFANHERSKKHTEKVAVLRALLEQQGDLEATLAPSAAQEEAPGRDPEATSAARGAGPMRGQEAPGDPPEPQSQPEGADEQPAGSGEESGREEEEYASTVEEAPASRSTAKRRKARRRRQQLAQEASSAGEAEAPEPDERSDASSATQEAASAEEEEEEGGPEAGGEEAAAGAQGAEGPQADAAEAGNGPRASGSREGEEPPGVSGSEPAAEPAAPVLGAAALKRAKKAAKAAAAAAGGAGSARAARPGVAEEAEGRPRQRGKKGRKGGGGHDAFQQPSATTCLTCMAELGTRNQLFKHIAATGHAQPRE